MKLDHENILSKDTWTGCIAYLGSIHFSNPVVGKGRSLAGWL
jgi:hypothetical protein